MINKRLTWFLEFDNHILPFHSGFRSGRSATVTNSLVRLGAFVCDAFVKGEHVVAVFFGLESTCDTTWRYGILGDRLGLRGGLPTFVEGFLANRTMRVLVGSSLSDHYD